MTRMSLVSVPARLNMVKSQIGNVWYLRSEMSECPRQRMLVTYSLALLIILPLNIVRLPSMLAVLERY